VATVSSVTIDCYFSALLSIVYFLHSLDRPRVYGHVVAPGSEDRREFHMTDVVRTTLPPMLRLRPSRTRDHPEADTTVKLTPEAVDREQTFGWLRSDRRLGNDYERKV
jgi:hypothetical protein